MAPKKEKAKIVENDFETELIKGLLDATERASLEDLNLKFTSEEVNLPEPIIVRNPALDDAALQAAGTKRKSKPRYVRGDHFYLYLGQKRVNGKWRGAGQFMKITGETKEIELKSGEIITVQIRKQSQPSKSWLARQNKAA